MNTLSRNIVVRFEHCDAAGIMFYPRFFALVNEMVEDWFAELGHPFAALHVGERKGVPTVRMESEFVSAVRMGETLSQVMGVEHVGRSSCALKHIASVGDRIVARFDQTIVYADLESMRAEPWPDALRAAISRFAGAGS
ncbi:acyl-CoA thioesterase [Terricaulis sp.]|uniref:acyl-CoA thioesterase n=1 Tax=Terricaulis sp. TaxID=2768686 RepID=UPI0037847A13